MIDIQENLGTIIIFVLIGIIIYLGYNYYLSKHKIYLLENKITELNKIKYLENNSNTNSNTNTNTITNTDTNTNANINANANTNANICNINTKPISNSNNNINSKLISNSNTNLNTNIIPITNSNSNVNTNVFPDSNSMNMLYQYEQNFEIKDINYQTQYNKKLLSNCNNEYCNNEYSDN